jgi:hypothetical protein
MFRYTLRARAWVVAAVDGHHPGAKKGTTMELLVLAIIVIVGFVLYRYMQRWIAR